MLVHIPAPRPDGTLRWAVFALLAGAVLVSAAAAAPPAPPKSDTPKPAAPAKKPPEPPKAPAEKAEPAKTPPPAEAKVVGPYVFFVDSSTVIQSAGATELERARKLRVGSDGKMLWFRKEGAEYILRDDAVLQSILDLHASAKKSQEQLRTIRRKDDEQSREMDRLVKEQAALDARLEALVEERTRLEAEAAGADDSAKNAPALERLKVEEGNLNKEVDLRDEEMDRLAETMDALTTDQERVSEEVERGSSGMEEQIRTILDESIRSGAAKRYRAKT